MPGPIQSGKKAQSANSAALTTTFATDGGTGTATAGHQLVAIIVGDASVSSVVATGTGGGAFTQRKAASSFDDLYIYDKVSDGTETGITSTLSSATGQAIWWFELPAGTLNVTASSTANSSGGTQPCGTLTPAAGDIVIWAAGDDSNNAGYTGAVTNADTAVYDGAAVSTQTGGTKVSLAVAHINSATAVSHTLGISDTQNTANCSGVAYAFSPTAAPAIPAAPKGAALGFSAQPGSLSLVAVPTGVRLAASMTPASADNDSGTPITLGTMFYSDVAGTISRIYYWRDGTANDGQTVQVAIYQWNGTLLGSGSHVQAVGDGIGWVGVDLSSPVSIAAYDHTGATMYVAAQYSPSGRYVYTTNTFALGGGGLNNAPLHAPDHATDNNFTNGVFNVGAGMTYPSTDFASLAFYFVDPLFAATPSAPFTATTASPSGFAGNPGSLSNNLNLTGPTPGVAGFAALPATSATSAPSNLALVAPALAEVGFAGQAAALEFDLPTTVSIAGFNACPGVLTSVSANLNVNVGSAVLGVSALPGVLHFDITGGSQYTGVAAVAGATALGGTVGLGIAGKPASSFGVSGRAGRLRIGLGRDVDFTYGFADEDQWSFGRADA